MKNALNRIVRPAVIAALTLSVLAGCDKGTSTHPSASPASSPSVPNVPAVQDSKISLLKDISGVWNPSTSDGLTTIQYADNRLQILQGNTPLPVTLGDVDPNNETVNVKVIAQAKEEILTIRKMWNADHTAYNLSLIGSSGIQETLGFVRRVSNDDLNRISRLTLSPASSAPQEPLTQIAAVSPAASGGGVIAMWLGRVDMNLRSCPGSTCSAVIVVPKDSKISVDTSTIRNVTEASGVQTPWARVTYEGAYCAPADLDQQVGCTTVSQTTTPVTGWINYSRLLSAPLAQE